MKRILLMLCLIVISFSLNVEKDKSDNKHIVGVIIDYPKPDLDLFLFNLAKRESNGSYTIVNKYGFMGKYQFSRSTLWGLGFKVSRREFLSNPELQEKAMMRLLRHNKFVLRRWIRNYDSTFVNNRLVTESGILAAAHLGGPRNVKNYLMGKSNAIDKFGTSVSSYMHNFSGYDLNL